MKRILLLSLLVLFGCAENPVRPTEIEWKMNPHVRALYNTIDSLEVENAHQLCLLACYQDEFGETSCDCGDR